MSSGSLLERALLHRLANSTGKVVDLAYTSLVHQLGLTQRFFPQGFGDLDLIDFHEDLKLFESWPPAHFADIKIDWKRVREGKIQGAAYDVFKAKFPTPMHGRAYDGLPPECRTADALWIIPRVSAPGAPTSIHLAATGDHGFARREHLGLPLVAQGIGTLALESPFYGQRRPAEQQGAKLRRVSDLLLLGRGTIEETLFLLHWLQGQGHQRLGVAGLSMGGVHATMIASLFPGPVALNPLLAPRSAAVAYCGGALFHATAWERLLADTQDRQEEIMRIVEQAAQGGHRLAEARIRLAKIQALAAQRAAEDAEKLLKKTNKSEQKLNVADVEGSTLENNSNNNNHHRSVDSMRPGPSHETVAASMGHNHNTNNNSNSNHFNTASNRNFDTIHTNGIGGGNKNGSYETSFEAASEAADRRATPLLPALNSWFAGWSHGLEGQLDAVRKLAKDGGDQRAAVELLQWVLETYTDVCRFPRPQRPDAAVLVAATEDAYVSPESVEEVHRHLPGSEIRWVPGGHVSSFLLHHAEFRKAIVDALNRL